MADQTETESFAGSTQPKPPGSRTGKVAINAYVPKPVRNQVKMLAMMRGTTSQSLFVEALNDLFAKHGFPEITPYD